LNGKSRVPVAPPGLSISAVSQAPAAIWSAVPFTVSDRFAASGIRSRISLTARIMLVTCCIDCGVSRWAK
jgi:hypothetical protein